MALYEKMMTMKVKAKYSFGFCLQKQLITMSSDAERNWNLKKNEVNPWDFFFLMEPSTKLKLALQMWHLDHFRFLVLFFYFFYFNLFSLFHLSAKLLCRDFKIQVLPAAFYLNENVNFKQSAASGKMSTQGCCCWGVQHLWLLQCWSKRMIEYYSICSLNIAYAVKLLTNKL